MGAYSFLYPLIGIRTANGNIEFCMTTTPEALTAALMVLALASCVAPGVRRRLVGAVAIACACLSRYEAWPVAFAFALSCLADARREAQTSLRARPTP